MTITFASDGEELRDSVDVFNLLVQQKEMLGEERVMSWLCQELVRGLSEVEGIELGELTDHLVINGVSVLAGLCLKNSNGYPIYSLVHTKNESAFLILVQLPNEEAYGRARPPSGS